MMNKKDKKKYDDDDGRTIADMSGVDHPATFFPKIPGKTDSSKKQQESGSEYERPWENNSLSKEERRAYILGALGATLLIASIFIAVFGFLIWFLLTVWT